MGKRRWQRAIGLVLCGTLSPTAVALGAAGPAAGRVGTAVSCGDVVAASKLQQLRSALLKDLPDKGIKAELKGPLLKLHPRICSLGASQYALAAFIIPSEDPAPQRFTFVRGRSDKRWYARVGSHSQAPLPCAIRAAFHLDEC